MTPLLRKLLGMNWMIVGLTIGLCILGVIAVYGASAFREDTYWHKQSIWEIGRASCRERVCLAV